MANPSPMTSLFQGGVLRYFLVWWSIMMGNVIESVQTKMIPMKVSIHPAI